MPFTLDIDPSLGLAQSRFHGVVTREDFREYLSALLGDPQWAPGFHQMADFSDAVEIPVSYEDIMTLAMANLGENRNRIGDGQIAFIVPSEVSFGMARQYGSLVEGMQRGFGVFRDEADARRWLGIDPNGTT